MKTIKLIVLVFIFSMCSKLCANETSGVPEFVDRFGVDLMSGSPAEQNLSLGIGTKESGILYSSSLKSIFSNNFTGSIVQLELISEGLTSPYYVVGLTVGTYYKVDTSNDSEIFKLATDGSLSNARDTGGKLSCAATICTYLNKYGEVVKFDKNYTNGYSNVEYESDSSSIPNPKRHKEWNIALQIENIKPDGEVISNVYERQLTYWDPTKLSSVTSSLGWMIKLSYSGITSNSSIENNIQSHLSDSNIRIKVINISEEFCNNAAFGNCDSLAKNWPSLNIKTSGSMSYSVVSVCGQACQDYIKFILSSLPSLSTYHEDNSGKLMFIGTMGYLDPSVNINKESALQAPTVNNGIIFYSTMHEITDSKGYVSKSSNTLSPCNKLDSYNFVSYAGVSRKYNIKSGFLVNNNPVSGSSQTECTYSPGQGTVNEAIFYDKNTGEKKHFSYDINFTSASGVVLGASIRSPEGLYVIDSSQFGLSSKTDNLERTWNFKYNSMGSYLDKIIDPDATPSLDAATGGLTDYDYDSRGNINSITVYPKNGGTPLVTSAEYPTDCDNPKTCNKPTSITDQNGVVTSYDYYPEHGGLKSVTKAAVDGVQAQTLYTYEQKTPYVKNSSGDLVASPQVWRLVSVSKCMTQTLNSCAGSADELRTEYSDFTNNLLSKKTTVKHGDDSVVLETTRDYDIYGNVTWEDGPRTGSYDTTYYFYDALRQKIGEIGTDPDGSGPLPRQATSIGYNDDGKVNSIKKGTVLGTSKASLDAMTVKEETATEYSTVHGLPIVESYLANGVLKKLIQKKYNADLRLECVAHRLSFSTDLDACTPSSATETYGENSVTVKDRITQYTYDATGAVLTTSTGVGTSLARTDRTNAYRLDNGLLASETDALGNVTSYGYDDFKRPTTTTYPKVGSDPATFTQKSYTDGKSFVSSVLLRDGQSIGFTPDSLYRIGAKTGAVVESFSYNNFDQVTSHTNSTTGGVAATSIYDRKAIGWLNSEQTAFGTVSYEYDAYGRRTKMTWPDNVYINYSYETNGYAGDQLQTITDSNDATLASFEYYDTGKRKTLTRGNGVVTNYGYDTMQRLETYGTDIGGTDTANDIAETFSYTLAGQLKNRKLTTNNADYTYLSSVASNTTYVPNALNQIATLDGVAFEYDKRGNLTKDNVGVTYEYNANNLLLSSTNTNGSASLRYDAENRLYSVTKGSNTTRFMYDGTDLIAETNRSNTILRRYIHGPETDDPIVWYEGAGTTDKRYYTTDRQGSIVGTTLQTGVNAAINAYDEYGIQKYPAFGRFQYTGQTWLPEVGLYYYKARLYSPSLGRFLQADPVGYKDGMNWYAYVGNDPVNHTDPTGMIIDVVADIGFIAYDVYAIATGGATAVNMAALGADVAGAVVPFATGAGPAVRAAHAAEAAVSAKKADFIVDSNGTAVRNSADGARKDLEAGGYPGKPTTQTAENGTIHEGVPGKDGPMDVRVMDGQSNGKVNKGERVVTTKAGTNNQVRTDGTTFKANESKTQQNKESHIHLTP